MRNARARLVRVRRSRFVGDRSGPRRTEVQGRALQQDFLQGMALYERFNRFGPSRAVRVRFPRVIPPVVVELGSSPASSIDPTSGTRVSLSHTST